MRSRSFVVPPPKDTNALVTDSQVVDDFTEVPDNGSLGNPDPNAPFIDSKSCLRDYVTVFGWNNPSADLMDEPPLLSSKKIATFHVGNAYITDAVTTGWRVESVLHKTATQSQLTVKVIKGDVNFMDSLDCYLVRFLDPSELNSWLANTLYSNLGLDKTANMLTGFLRHPKQYIACRVSAGNGSIEVINPDGSSAAIAANQPFVLKRGCYQ